MLSVAIFLLAFVVVVALLWWAIRDPANRAALLIVALLWPFSATASAFSTFITAATPGLLELMSVAITALIGWAVAKASKKWGIEIEAKHREALHSALMNAARLALSHQLTGDKAVSMIVDYARQSVPDAIGNLKAPSNVLNDLARAKLEQAIGEQSGPAVDALAGALRRAGAV